MKSAASLVVPFIKENNENELTNRLRSVVIYSSYIDDKLILCRGLQLKRIQGNSLRGRRRPQKGVIGPHYNNIFTLGSHNKTIFRL